MPEKRNSKILQNPVHLNLKILGQKQKSKKNQVKNASRTQTKLPLITLEEDKNNSLSELEKLINTKTEIKNGETDVPIIKSDSANLMAKIKKVIKTEPFD